MALKKAKGILACLPLVAGNPRILFFDVARL